MREDQKHLQLHGKQWRVIVKVPLDVKHMFNGKQRITVPLHTDSLLKANVLKRKIILELQQQFTKARYASAQGYDVSNEAISWRSALAEELGEQLEVQSNDGRVHKAILRPLADNHLYDRAAEIEVEQGEAKAQQFLAVAQGEATPIAAPLSDWRLERSDMKPKTLRDYNRAVVKFVSWLDMQGGLSSTIEAVDRRLCGQYIAKQFISKQAHVKTANLDISALSSYWRWLIKRGYTENNPWQLQSLNKKVAPKLSKRPWTNVEIIALLEGCKESDTLLPDMIMVASHSGMRLGEIVRLCHSSIVGEMIHIHVAKTEAGLREVPIHQAITHIIRRRMEGKSGNDSLFPELFNGKRTEDQAITIVTKRFIWLRRKIGLEDKKQGQRQSNVDFHSFRRWFVSKARDALQAGAQGFDQWTIAEVVGHETESKELGLAMTMGRYAGKQSVEAKVACVRSVQLETIRVN